MQDNSANVAIAIFGSVVGALVVWASEGLKQQFQSKSGSMTGVWHQIIPAYGDEPAKRDQVKCKHAGEKIAGSIRRLEPLGEHEKTWKFEGRMIKHSFFGTFWSSNPSKNPDSYGTLHLNFEKDNHPHGFYVKLRPGEINYEESSSKFDRIPFEWKRVK